MMNTGIIFILGVLTACLATKPPFFRRDYHYNLEYNAFYKHHDKNENFTYEEAFETCADEGSKVFYPKWTDEWTILQTFMPISSEPIQYILVGFYHDTSMSELITVDGLPTPIPLTEEETDSNGSCVYMNINGGSIRNGACSPQPEEIYVRGFVCKREYDLQPCPTIDKNYEYNEETKKCYKLNKREKTWSDAMTTCFMEGGSLLVTRNHKEREIISNFLRNHDVQKETFVGYHKSPQSNKFYTVKGDTLEEGFYLEYNNNNYGSPADNDCGAYKFYNGDSLVDIKYSCQVTLPFICEINANY